MEGSMELRITAKARAECHLEHVPLPTAPEAGNERLHTKVISKLDHG
jgi:hypothetical protein